MTEPVQRRRPRDRRAQIERVAALEFADRGFLAASVDEIGAAVDVSGAALYRHFPSKYALFRHVIDTYTDVFCAALESAVSDADAPPRDRVDAILRSALRVSVDRRDSGSMFRWEQRFLEPADRRRVRDRLNHALLPMRTAAAEFLAGLDADEIELRCIGAIAVMGSVTAHRTRLAVGEIEGVLLPAAWRVLDRRDDAGGLAPVSHTSAATLGTDRENTILVHAVDLFFERGFHAVAMADVAAASAIAPSGIYRYFANKDELLYRAFLRAGDLNAEAIAEASAVADDPSAALDALCAAYIGLCFSGSRLMTLYFREAGSLPADSRRRLAAVQRRQVDDYVRLLRAVEPAVTVARARFLVHAGIAVIFDVGRSRRFTLAADFQHLTHALFTAVLRP
ncbi:TetR/AcrR family transcriptional regulator [Williamsia maris]|uniref:TetR/AcrR family transcriptional regulator n=1 Tax=Williamsia maris TaxID=72806 RepID=UPI0031D7A482